MMILWNFLGIPFVGYSMYINWTNVEGHILFALSAVFVLIRGYFYIMKNIQDIKNRDLSLRKKEHDVEKEINDDEN